MKIVSLKHDGNLIEVHNNFLTGVETVYFNGYRVARAFNWFSGVHEFMVSDESTGNVDHYRVEFTTSFRNWYGCAVDVLKNGICIHDESGRYPRQVYTYSVNNPRSQSGYDRSIWTDSAEPVSRPLYNEADLV
ncbi:hypothetical protein [Lewinella sp. 4G2]|uniref:hypothetical protein n=1 Tax=Lewinella sp. 4G2 TaxID=1803372 RepID=UPI0007B4B1B8|nr:hypothetical protein [Lewinella sp. 4G2]OAV44979.1 hypothetical protein A3850_010955 [Lewinella sp. 4G2]